MPRFAVVASVIVVAAAVSSAVFLLNSATVRIQNTNCGPIKLSPGFIADIASVLPRVDIPEEIPEGSTTTVSVPVLKANFQAEDTRITIGSFGRTLSIPISRKLDLDGSRWDTVALRGLDQPVSIGWKGDHTLTIVCER